MLYSVGTAIAYGVGAGAVMVAGGLAHVRSRAASGYPHHGGVARPRRIRGTTSGTASGREGLSPNCSASCRVVPPLIGTYVDTSGDKHFMNMLFAVAGHRVDDIDTDRLGSTDTPSPTSPESRPR